jgi:16S rRNA (cytidine1402-2'-O)-methyltransferase
LRSRSWFPGKAANSRQAGLIAGAGLAAIFATAAAAWQRSHMERTDGNSSPAAARAEPRGFVIGQAAIPARPLAPALYLVATPIGNLGDVTIRALETLAAADVVAAEDTRVTRVLLDRYGIRQRPVAYHEHNAEEAGPRLIAALAEGRSVALVSDAGTPLVSDPGYRLVERALAAGIAVVPIPGPSAVLAALVASGLPSDAFLFAGFLPARAGQRSSRLEALKAVPATLVFFESPHRLAESLAAMAGVLGESRGAVVARELTKAFEELRRATLGELAAHYRDAPAPKGEIVICIGPPEAAPATGEDVDALLNSLSAEMPASKAAAEAARMTGLAKPDLYRRLIALKAGRNG